MSTLPLHAMTAFTRNIQWQQNKNKPKNATIQMAKPHKKKTDMFVVFFESHQSQINKN
eukprot:m.184764 g.184764  ORF g.184764 m.184764 type:complete len:58 (-) comp32206_c0_seq2:270-443(-)